jgi:DNA-3-methyladenine glycosylase
MEILPRDFYLRDTTEVARDFLGRELVCRTREGETAGIIVETEAYLGTGDRAAHVFGGRRTPRTEVLFAPGGLAYVYLIYGLHHCQNLTTGAEQTAECVLIRALEPVAGLDLMVARRGTDRRERLAAGPGRLCQALGIGRELNGESLTGNRLFVREGRPAGADGIVPSRRIGIGYAAEARDWLLRFHVKGSSFVSKG